MEMRFAQRFVAPVALRYGFVFEGIFRRHMINKGHSRDTAYFSMLDGEWLDRKRNFERWLQAGNFDWKGRQKISPRSLTALRLIARLASRREPHPS